MDTPLLQFIKKNPLKMGSNVFYLFKASSNSSKFIPSLAEISIVSYSLVASLIASSCSSVALSILFKTSKVFLSLAPNSNKTSSTALICSKAVSLEESTT